VASNGLIEKVRTNTIPYSQAFDNAAWIKDRNGTGVMPVVTANNATAPDGTLTADTIVFNAGAGTTTGDSSVVYQTITPTGLCTASFYARVTSGTGQLVFRSVAGATYTTANLTTTWQRFSAAENGSSGFFEIGIRRGLSNEPINASVTVQMWGAQFETGDIATDYIPTTTAAVSVGPVSGLPRLDYLNSTCPRLLLEPQRTNLTAQSEDFNGWGSKVNVTTTANYAVSPDGYTNADRLQFTGNGFLYGTTGFNQTSGTVYTLSCYAKRNGSGTQSIGFFVDGSGGVNSAWTLTSNWQRFTYTYTAGNTSTVGIAASSGADVSVYGFQFEAGAYATSYIPTLGASVTRVADAASKTGISSLIGQTEGTLFLDFDFTNISTIQVILSLHDGANNKRLEIWASSNTLYGFIGGSVNIDIGNLNLTNGRHKVALAYKQSGEQAFYVDGVQVGTSATAYTISALTALSYDFWNTGYPPTAAVRQTLLFKTRLTNAQLAELTAL
jgi:hypothetical protein